MQRPQKDIWSQEHKTAAALPTETGSNASQKPSGNVVLFLDWLTKQGVPMSGRAVDIGSGKGRNALYLAQRGFAVYAMDFVSHALAHMQHQAKQMSVNKNITGYQVAIDERWPFANDVFDIAVDNYGSIDIETLQGRLGYRQELLRTLKPGGYALVCVVSADDELEATLPKGPEQRSTIWPDSGKFQKNYTEEELREFYKDFEIVDLRRLQKQAHRLGRDYIATNLWMALRKR